VKGKTVVITGGTSGIGEVAAEALAQIGARIILVARSKSRAEATLARLRRSGPGAAHSVYFADLTRLAEMKHVAAEIAHREPPIDVLINNAGSIFPTRAVTVDGLERTFALNHMAYFVLTHRLRERLIASAPARIVNTASAAHQGQYLDFNDLQMENHYRARTAYGRSKLANILFTRELARGLAGTGITANCLHPGFVATGLGQRDSVIFGTVMRLSMLFAGNPEQGARMIIHLAASPDVASTTGSYFVDCHEAVPSRNARDDGAARRLWDETTQLARL